MLAIQKLMLVLGHMSTIKLTILRQNLLLVLFNLFQNREAFFATINCLFKEPFDNESSKRVLHWKHNMSMNDSDSMHWESGAASINIKTI